MKWFWKSSSFSWSLLADRALQPFLPTSCSSSVLLLAPSLSTDNGVAASWSRSKFNLAASTAKGSLSSSLIHAHCWERNWTLEEYWSGLRLLPSISCCWKTFHADIFLIALVAAAWKRTSFCRSVSKFSLVRWGCLPSCKWMAKDPRLNSKGG